MACKELGIKKIPVIRLDHLSDEERKAYMLAHNQLTMNSGFEMRLLNEELEVLKDFNMEDFGFKIEKEDEIKEPEIKFTEILGEEHNYIVLYFDNEVDWLQAESLFGIEKVRNLSTRKDGKISKEMESYGIGRVIKGRDAINKIMELK